MDKQIVANDWFNKPKEIIAKLTNEEKAFNFALLNKLDDVKQELRNCLINSNVNKIELTLPNGLKQVITISRGGETIKTTINKVVDWDKALQYAKENNCNVPMTKPQVDYAKLECEDWFQENVDKFITKKEETKKVKSYDRIIVKDIKE